MEAINAGCDMFLFFHDPEEDWTALLDTYRTGIISEARMTEALKRILGTKAQMGLHKRSIEEIVPAAADVQGILHNPEYQAYIDSFCGLCDAHL